MCYKRLIRTVRLELKGQGKPHQLVFTTRGFIVCKTYWIVYLIFHLKLKQNVNFSLITWKQNLWWLLICNDIYARFKASFWIRKFLTFECTSVHIINLLFCLFMFFKNKVSHGRSTFKKLDLALSITNPIYYFMVRGRNPELCQNVL